MAAKKTSKQKSPYPPENYVRNEFGLLENVEYQFNEDSSVNWRAMIPEEFLYANPERFKNTEVPTSTEGLKDNELLILLGGIKYLAKLRGFYKVEFDVEQYSKNYVAAKCRIGWLPNYETGSKVVYEEYANATSENTNDFCLKFLETIDFNIAFVRCVLNFLNINIVGVDELDNSRGFAKPHVNEEEEPNAMLSPQSNLEQAVANKYAVDFEEFKSKQLREFWQDNHYRNPETVNWKSFSDIPAKEARKLLEFIKTLP